MKKLLATLLASSMALAAIGGLVACGGDDEEDKVTPVKATGFTLTNLYGQAVDSVTLAPDGTVGVLAKLQPANANSTVKWTTSNGELVSVGGGGLYNAQALIMGLDTGTASITAEVEGIKITLPVTVTDWTRFMLVGTNNSWASEDDSEQWLFTQDEHDKHLWTIDVELSASSMVKIVAAADNGEGKVVGLGWDGGYNLGINTQEPDENEDVAKRKKQVIEGTEGVLNIYNNGGSGNIALGEDGTEGTYRFTLKTRSGGAFDSLSYKLIPDEE